MVNIYLEIICILDYVKANELIQKGFTCISPISNKEKFYQFVKTPELENCLKINFSNQDFFINKDLFF